MDLYRVYDQCQPCQDGFYIAQCDSSSFSLYLSRTIYSSRFGPPYIPLFPIPMNRSKRIYIFINPKYDSLHHTFDAPEFALKPKNSNVLVLPEWVDTDGRVTPPFTYRYLFNIWGYSPDTLEVIFLKSYHGCDIPNVTFIATKKTEYEPFVFPAH